MTQASHQKFAQRDPRIVRNRGPGDVRDRVGEVRMKGKCILLGKELSASNDSRAHVIPSALGGRLKPKGF